MSEDNILGMKIVLDPGMPDNVIQIVTVKEAQLVNRITALAAEVARLNGEVEAAHKNEQRYMTAFAETNEHNSRLQAALEAVKVERDEEAGFHTHYSLQLGECEAENARLRADLAALVAEGEWISVEERLPELANNSNSHQVLVLFSNRKTVAIGAYYKGLGWTASNGDYTGYAPVIAWRPLPSPSSPALAQAKATLEGGA